MCMYVCMYMYIYTHTERERERYTHVCTHISLSLSIYIYTYTYIYRERERERDGEMEMEMGTCQACLFMYVAYTNAYIMRIHIHVHIIQGPVQWKGHTIQEPCNARETYNTQFVLKSQGANVQQTIVTHHTTHMQQTPRNTHHPTQQRFRGMKTFDTTLRRKPWLRQRRTWFGVQHKTAHPLWSRGAALINIPVLCHSRYFRRSNPTGSCLFRFCRAAAVLLRCLICFFGACVVCLFYTLRVLSLP